MTDDQQVLYVRDLARLLGMSEAAIRGHYYRRSGALPPTLKLGARLAWRRATVLSWLAEKEKKAPG